MGWDANLGSYRHFQFVSSHFTTELPPQILDWGGNECKWKNTLAYYNTAVKSLIVQAPGELSQHF
jgi:hypothetical protein